MRPSPNDYDDDGLPYTKESQCPELQGLESSILHWPTRVDAQRLYPFIPSHSFFSFPGPATVGRPGRPNAGLPSPQPVNGARLALPPDTADWLGESPAQPKFNLVSTGKMSFKKASDGCIVSWNPFPRSPQMRI